MRTTVTLDDDTRKAIEQLRRERDLGLSEAVNELIRAGLRHKPTAPPFRQRTRSLGLRIDVTNIAEALAELDGPTSR
jgi:hypothetical protein